MRRTSLSLPSSVTERFGCSTRLRWLLGSLTALALLLAAAAPGEAAARAACPAPSPTTGRTSPQVGVVGQLRLGPDAYATGVEVTVTDGDGAVVDTAASDRCGRWRVPVGSPEAVAGTTVTVSGEPADLPDGVAFADVSVPATLSRTGDVVVELALMPDGADSAAPRWVTTLIGLGLLGAFLYPVIRTAQRSRPTPDA